MAIEEAKSRMPCTVQKNNDDFMNIQKNANAVKRDADNVSDVLVYISMTATHAVNQIVRTFNMPKVDLQPVSGNPLTFCRFMRQFNNSIGNNCVCPEERLNYLGQPRDIVAGWLDVDPNMGYIAALRDLEELHHNEDVIVIAIVSKVLALLSIKADYPPDLSKFSIFLTEYDNAVSIDVMGVINYSETQRESLVNYYITSIIDGKIMFLQRKRGERVKFSKLVKFVRTQTKKSSNPTYGRESPKVWYLPHRGMYHPKSLQRSGWSLSAVYNTIDYLLTRCSSLVLILHIR